RALIIAWVSFDTFIEPAITWSTNSPIRSLARARCSSSRPIFACEMIWSRRLTSSACAADAGWLCSEAPLDMLRILLRLGAGAAGLGAQLLERVRVLDHVLEQLFELLVAVHLTDEVGQAVARLEELAERLDLLGHLLGLEVTDVAEPQLDAQFR